MSRADELRAALAVAELEDQLAAAKESGGHLDDIKNELRYSRWVARGGPAEEAALLDNGWPHTNRHVAEFYRRWQREG